VVDVATPALLATFLMVALSAPRAPRRPAIRLTGWIILIGAAVVGWQHGKEERRRRRAADKPPLRHHLADHTSKER